MMNLFKKKKPELDNAPDLHFVDITRKAYNYHPIQIAKDVPAHFTQHQVQRYGSFKFAHCPGMVDFMNYGYLIPAWDDIHIMANSSGSLAVIGGDSSKNRPNHFAEPRKMSSDIGDGVFEPKGVPYEVIHIGSPWKVMCKNKQVSVFAMPAFYHSKFLDDIYIYPGIVDYGNFSEINLICSPKRECNITIKAGEPLLQIIPFFGQEISAGYGPATEQQKDKSESYISTAKQFYRKLAMVDKPATITKVDE